MISMGGPAWYVFRLFMAYTLWNHATMMIRSNCNDDSCFCVVHNTAPWLKYTTVCVYEKKNSVSLEDKVESAEWFGYRRLGETLVSTITIENGFCQDLWVQGYSKTKIEVGAYSMDCIGV